MRTGALVKHSLTYYWRTNLAIVLGVATAVAVLAGALLVGDSVRASLRDLFLLRIGNADLVISATHFFREQLADDLQSHDRFASDFDAVCPLIALEGIVIHQESGRRGSGVQVYGVDDRFWKFHGREAEGRAPADREAFLSESLAQELTSKEGDTLLVLVEKPSAIPRESLHGRKDDPGRAIRLSLRQVLPASELGEFSLRPQQGSVRAVFVSLRRLQRDLEQDGKANTILVSEKRSEAAARSESITKLLKDKFALEDVGIKLRVLEEQQCLLLESDRAVIDDALARAARSTAARLSLNTLEILTYLANTIRSGRREVPYSLVTALDRNSFEKLWRGDAGKSDAGMRKQKRPTSERPTSKAKPTSDVGRTDVGRRTDVTNVNPQSAAPPILINEWAAQDLNARPGDLLTLDYYLWQEEGRLITQTAQFQLMAVVPVEGIAADRNLAPEYPGITDSDSLSDWDPPFPIDLGRIRPRDEQYWDRYRTTPKAFIPLERGQELWQSRFGKLTSLRIFPPHNVDLQAALQSYGKELRAALNPLHSGFSVYPARAQGLEASRGATDFGEYFLYFSFFLVASALLLAGLFFKLSVEQRLREIGLLRAIGFPGSKIRALFLSEGIVLSTIGSALGLIGALAYGGLIMLGLRTWWVGAVGTTLLTLHISFSSLILGAAGGILAALICIAWTLRALAPASPRSLLTGSLNEEATEAQSVRRSTFVTSAVRRPPSDVKNKTDIGRGTWRRRTSLRTPHSAIRNRRTLNVQRRIAVAFALMGLFLLLGASLGWIGQTAGFFGAGTLLLIAILCCQSVLLRGSRRKLLKGSGWWPVSRLGFRNATYRPGRSMLCIALIASATFIIVAVDAFRRDDQSISLDRRSGSGGFPLLAESLLPLTHDLNTAEGREELNLSSQSNSALEAVSFTRFRVRPGDDASCLNLYQPRNPRILAPTDDFLKSGRFSFQSSLAKTQQEKENPWLLLNREEPDGAVPVIADANSLTYVLRLKLGDEFVLDRGSGEPIRMRIVGALADSIFQGELLMSEKNFLRLFPGYEGYRFFLLDAPPERAATVSAILEEQLSNFGFDVIPTGERLASFHRVENTYLSTFQTLGGLGLVLGTLGLATVLLRNVLERRRELALLRAVGYNSTHFAVMVIAENALLLIFGLVTGAICALLAIAPAFSSRGGHLPTISLGLLLLTVLLTGLTASVLATAAAIRSPLLQALRAE